MLGVIRVLIADDMPEIRALLRTNLEFDGRFEIVDEAENGLQAVAMVTEHKPDVVLLDLAMPEMDGLAAIAKIRQVAPGTKIVVLSAFSEDHNSGLVRSLGANAFLAKDRPLELILDTIADVADVPKPEA